MVKVVEELELSDQVLFTLEQLDTAVLNAREVFNNVFVRLMRHRFPVGQVVELGRLSILHGHPHGATHAKVIQHFQPNITLARPENTRLHIDAVTLRKDGSETTNRLRISEPLLTRAYELGSAFDDKALSPRDQLAKLIKAMEAAEAAAVEMVETGPTTG